MCQNIGAVIAVRNILTPLCLFIQTSPNNLAVTSGNGNRFFTKNCTFNLQINFYRHNAGLKFCYCLRFDLPNFSLPLLSVVWYEIIGVHSNKFTI
jgi:hypothetical protein